MNPTTRLDKFRHALQAKFLTAMRERDIDLQSVPVVNKYHGKPYRLTENAFDVLRDAMMDHTAFRALTDKHQQDKTVCFKAYELAGAEWYVERYAEDLFSLDEEAQEREDYRAGQESQAEFLADCRRAGNI